MYIILCTYLHTYLELELDGIRNSKYVYPNITNFEFTYQNRTLNNVQTQSRKKPNIEHTQIPQIFQKFTTLSSV